MGTFVSAPRTSPATSATTVARRHLFSVDVEEYFQVNAFDRIVRSDDWSRYPSRVEGSVDSLLEMLAEHDSTATFFCLGWVAERHRGMIRRIADCGHEIASHGWWHRRIPTLTRDAFAAEVRESKQLLEDISSTRVVGYRAPSFSIIPGYEWAFDVLVEQGYEYDSSVFPIRRRGYGYPSAPPVPHQIVRSTGVLTELPPATLAWRGMRLPAAGGGYLRQFPVSLIQAAVRQYARQGAAAMLYVHPWEVDPGQPRLPVGLLTRVRHYRGLNCTADRLHTLFREFKFTAASHYLRRSDATRPLGNQARFTPLSTSEVSTTA